jgi:hypothetical protein
VPVRPEGQAAVAMLAAQRNNAPLAAVAQPSTSRAAMGADRPSQESQAAQLAVGELLVAARRAELSFIVSYLAVLTWFC